MKDRPRVSDSLAFSLLSIAAGLVIVTLLSTADAANAQAANHDNRREAASPSVQTGIWHVTITDASIAPDSLDIQVGDAVVFTYLGAQAAVVRSDIQPRAFLPAISGQAPSGLARASAVETLPPIFSATLLSGNAFTVTFGSAGEVAYGADIAGLRLAGLIRVLQSPKITFRSAESASVTSGDLTVAKPAGTTAGDVMIASIAVRPSSTTITAPAGWTLIQRVDNANVTDSALAVYYRVAGAAEGTSYFWDLTNGNTGAVVGIQSFSGVNTVTPLDQFAGQNTPLGLAHSAPSIATTVNGAMIVTSHAFATAATWTPPAGMTESFDRASVAVPNVAGISLEANRVYQTTAQATGALTAVASDLADVGNAIVIALRPLP